MRRITLFLLLGLMLALLPSAMLSAQEAQPAATGTICVLAFEDRNGNTVRDADDPPMAGITANLALESGVIIATHITGTSENPYCFTELAPNTYQISFADSANHIATTGNNAKLELQSGQRLRASFGAQSQEALPLTARITDTNADESRLDTTSRILLGLLGAVVVMVLMIGFGAVVISLTS